jgi:hypothetical protein
MVDGYQFFGILPLTEGGQGVVCFFRVFFVGQAGQAWLFIIAVVLE